MTIQYKTKRMKHTLRHNPQKSLVVLCAGDTSLHRKHHCHWCHPQRTYDVAIIYYGNNQSIQKEYQKEANYFVCQTGPKWSLLRTFLLQHQARCKRYAFVAFPDDDLKITVDQWNALFEIGHQYRLDVFQPSLVHNGFQYIKHTHLVSQPQNTLRYTNFVEIMVPILSHRALENAHTLLTSTHLKSGWGIDYVLPKAVLPHRHYDTPPNDRLNRNTYIFAIIDSIAITHTQPLSKINKKKTASLSSFYQTFNIDPEAEMHHVMKMHRVKPFTPETLRCVPVSVNYEKQFRTSSNRPRSKATLADLPHYLTENLTEELRNVYARRHPDYKTATDIRKFYHKITYGFHARIHKNKLIVVRDFGSFQSRNINTVSMLHDVLCRYTIKDTEILVSTDDTVRFPDVRGVPILCMAKRANQTYLTYPDHTFYNWSEARTEPWDKERTKILKSNTTRRWQTKTNKAFFRGNLDTSYVRKHLRNACQMQHNNNTPHRPNRRKQHKKSHTHRRVVVSATVLDVAGVNVNSLNATKHTTRKRQRKHASLPPPSTFVSIADHNQWKYLLHIPGISYAARLKYLMMCNSVVLYVCKGRQYEYSEFWYKYLQDGVNCVQIMDRNRYNHHNHVVCKRDKSGQKIWDDRANTQIVDDIESVVHSFESGTRDYRAMVKANDEWRHQFDYEMVLTYFAVLLDMIR